MKNILVLIILFLAFEASTQVEVNVTAKPQGSNEFISNVPAFSFSEPFKLIIDVSNVPKLAGQGPVYIWSFIQGCCGSPSNGDFCNSNEGGKMTSEGNNKWSILIPSIKSFVGVGYKSARDAAIAAGRPGDQTRFGFLAKLDNGCSGEQSNDMEIPFTGPVYIKSEFESFPINASQSDVLTLVYNQDLEDDTDMKVQSEVYLYATAELEGGGDALEPVIPAEVGNTPALKLTKNGSQYTINIIPTEFFDVPAGSKISEINVLMRSKTDAEINFGAAQVVKMVKVK